MLKKYCGNVTIWTYPLPPMSPLVTILDYPPPPPPVTSFLNDPQGVPSHSGNNEV